MRVAFLSMLLVSTIVLSADVVVPGVDAFCGSNDACRAKWQKANDAAAKEADKEKAGGSDSRASTSNSSSSNSGTSGTSSTSNGAEFQDTRGLAENAPSKSKGAESNRQPASTSESSSGKQTEKKQAASKEESKGLPF